MLLAYFDEVKPGDGQPYYWLGGLMLTPEVVPTLEVEMNALAEACFGKDAGLTKETEFHATNIWSGIKNFKRLRDPGKRIEILKQLLTIAKRRDGVFHVAVRLDITKITAMSERDIEPTALMYMIERINGFARKGHRHYSSGTWRMRRWSTALSRAWPNFVRAERDLPTQRN